MRKQAIWTVIATGLGYLFHIGQIMLAARYFSPTELGQMAMVNITLAITLGIQDMGLSNYCIHIGKSDKKTNSTLFFTSIFIGCMVAGLVNLIALPMELFYEMPGLSKIMFVLSINFIVLSLSSQYQAHLIRTFKSDKLANIEVISRLISFVIVYYMIVFQHIGPIALAIGLVVFGLNKLIFLVLISPLEWHPSLQFDQKVATKGLRYGSYQTGTVVISQLGLQLDQLIIGKILGAESIGLYSLAKELVNYPFKFIYPIITRLVMPLLASLQNSPAKMRRSFLKTLRLTLAFSWVFQTILGVFSIWFIEVIYGKNYFNLKPLLCIMLGYATLRPIGSIVGVYAQAIGKTVSEFYWNLYCWPLSIPFLFVVGKYFPTKEAFAINNSILQLVFSIIIYPLFVNKLDKIGFIKYIKILLKIYFAIAISTLISWEIDLPSIGEYVSILKVFVAKIKLI